MAQTKFQATKKLRMKMCRKGHKTQKKCVKISTIRFKEVIFTVPRSKARILLSLWTILRRRASACLSLLETLGGNSLENARADCHDTDCHKKGGGNSWESFRLDCYETRMKKLLGEFQKVTNTNQH